MNLAVFKLFVLFTIASYQLIIDFITEVSILGVATGIFKLIDKLNKDDNEKAL